MRRGRAGLPENPAEVLAAVRTVAKEFPEVDVWEVAHQVVWRTANCYDPRRGDYLRFLGESLRKRTGVIVRREGRRLRRVRRLGRGRHPRPEPDEVAFAFKRWSERLLDLAADRLPEQARQYLLLMLQDVRVGDIAVELGVSPHTLSNKYGGDKLGRLIRVQVGVLINGLRPAHLAALVRHLREDAGLSQNSISRLIGPVPERLPQVPLLEEVELLRQLAWDIG